MRRLILLATISAVLIASTAATAATIGDLQALGFTVSVSSQLPGATPGKLCNVYYVSGFGNSSYFNECDAGYQAAIDSWANPVGFCNVKWQYQHPEQLAALQSITGKGWGVSGDQCADSYTVTNPNTSAAAYSGPGSGLAGFDQANGAPPAAPAPAPGTPTPATAPAPTSGPTTCLPLCPNPGETRGGGGVIPAPAPVTVAAVTPTLTAAVTASVAPAAGGTPVDTSSFTIVPASAAIVESTDVVGWINTPYMTTAV